MKLKLRTLILTLAIPALPGLLLTAHAQTQAAQFNLQQATIAPGTVLQPGNYSIRVIDHLQDRYLVRVAGSGTKSGITFIAVPSRSIAGGAGAVTWSTASEDKPALRGFVFGKGASSLEFVYPKDEAVSLAKANGAGVLAVDPASEGKPAELASLNKEDMQVVTLWMLTPQRVDATGGDVKIAAARYQGTTPAEGQQMASAHRPAPLKRLPHTASPLPLLLLAGIFAAFGASLLRMRRLRAVTAS